MRNCKAAITKRLQSSLALTLLSMDGLRMLYSGLMALAKPLARRKWQRRARQEAAYGEHLEERFGRYTVPRPKGDVLWVHAVSLGETKAAEPLLAALRKDCSHIALLLTHCTATGWEAGLKLLREGDMQVWLPWDNPASVHAFYAHFRPQLGLIMETEVWPNLILQAQSLGIPLALVNARMSRKSERKFACFMRSSRALFSTFSQVLAQSQADAERLRNLGAKTVVAAGNLKFDAKPNQQQLEQGRAWRQTLDAPVLAFVNTRPGEETLFLQACLRQQPWLRALGLQLLLVPRHPQRFAEVARLCQKMDFVVAPRSQWQSNGPILQNQPGIWLGDSLGEMSLYYGLSDVALMGGSFGCYGAHNLIEACACGIPVWVGPHTYNFAQAASDGVQAQAVHQCLDIETALTDILSVLQTQQQAAQARAHAINFAAVHTGAVIKSAAQLRTGFPALFAQK